MFFHFVIVYPVKVGCIRRDIIEYKVVHIFFKYVIHYYKFNRRVSVVFYSKPQQQLNEILQNSDWMYLSFIFVVTP